MSIKTVFYRTKHYIGRHKRIVFGMLIFIFIFQFFLYFYKTHINKIINETIDIDCKALAVRAMNNAINDIIMESVVYDDIINIIYNKQGNIEVIQANYIEINSMIKDLSLLTEVYINNFGSNGVNIPIGNFTGIPLLVGAGPDVNLKVKPIGAVVCKFSSKFESAGINQTNHKIYLTVSSSISAVVPLVTTSIMVEQQVLISESIIVGKVPEVYLYSDQLDTLLNFVPY